jgi:large subunit ribosomal protein L32
MPVPKQRQSRTRSATRRAQHDKIKAPNLGTCPDCGAAVRPHHVCPKCGYYDGRKVIEVPEAEVTPEENKAA